MSRQAVHPFPARMAPELTERFISSLPGGSTVLDPMMGSGSFPLDAAARGHTALGMDTDPLAVVIAETAGHGYKDSEVLEAAHDVVRDFQVGDYCEVAKSDESQRFIDFWFDAETRDKLAGLALRISDQPPHVRSALWCAFSRLIITKDKGASRARDVSHSRPHRVRDKACFDVVDKFVPSVETVVRRASQPRLHQNSREHDLAGTFTVLRADSRQIPLGNQSVDAVMTSPPYLVAIDYLRGHRLSLVWMGYEVGYLRGLRSSNIGTERGSGGCDEIDRVRESSAPNVLALRDQKLINRYIGDIWQVVSEIARVLRADAHATFVIADARLRGASVSVERIVTEVCHAEGLIAAERLCRDIPASRRYLPPPSGGDNALDLRMRQEVILDFVRS